MSCGQSSRDADARDRRTRRVTGSTCCRSVQVMRCEQGSTRCTSARLLVALVPFYQSVAVQSVDAV